MLAKRFTSKTQRSIVRAMKKSLPMHWTSPEKELKKAIKRELDEALEASLVYWNDGDKLQN